MVRRSCSPRLADCSGSVVGASGIRLLEVLVWIACRSGRASRSMAGWRRLASLARLFWESSSGADRVVQPAQPSRECAPIGIPHEHVSRAAQRLRQGIDCRADRARVCSACGCALLGLSLKNVMAVSPGFRADHVLIGQFTLPYGRFPGGSPTRRGPRSVAGSDRTTAGVAAAGTITNVPLSGDNGKTAITPKGYVPQPGESPQGHYLYGITGDYFSALGIPLREGRFLTSADSHRPSGSVSWMKTSHGVTGQRVTRSVNACFKAAIQTTHYCSPLSASSGRSNRRSSRNRRGRVRFMCLTTIETPTSS